MSRCLRVTIYLSSALISSKPVELEPFPTRQIKTNKFLYGINNDLPIMKLMNKKRFSFVGNIVVSFTKILIRPEW